MRVPLSWLKEYVEFDATPEELAARLTLSGTEVEGIETIGAGYDGVCVAEILAVEPHPDADNLSICRVNSGTGELRVVCGAPNARVGLKVPLAQVGAELPNGMTIKPVKIRGVASEGMLCAEDELGIPKEHAGLMELDNGLTAGAPFSDVMGPPETVLNIEITPNRPDCLSIIGIAREVAALFETTLRWPSIELPETDPAVQEHTRVDLQDPAGCPRYTARVLDGIRIGPAPRWIQQRLTHAGLRPINNVVDITNYVMLECGQPLHAFDKSLLGEGRIVVRRATQGEPLATLDGVNRPLTPDMLVIADADRAVALAGVMGGAGSEIIDDTRTVLLESAFFEPRLIRKTAKQLGLMTESSYRFERGVDIGRVEWASRRAAALMVAHAGATAAQGVIDAFPTPPPPMHVTCRHERTRALLGVEVTNAEITAIFSRLQLDVGKETATGCTVTIPTFRVDLEREVDLIEEVARIHGLEKIPVLPPHGRLVPDATDDPTRAAIACKSVLAGLGLSEIYNYSFVSAGLLDIFELDSPATRIVLPNPVSMEHGLLRNTLLPQMVETLGHIHAHQQDEAALFETGRVFFMKDGEPAEEERLAIGLMGPVGRPATEKRHGLTGQQMFAWLRGILEGLAHTLALRNLRLEQADLPCAEPGHAAAVMLGERRCGTMALIRQTIRERWRILEPVAVLELDMQPILTHVFDVPKMKAITPYPAIVRDMALLVDRTVPQERIRQHILTHAPPELESVELFDMFAGKGVPEDKKSLAYSIRYRAADRTLTDHAVNAYHTGIKEALRIGLGAEIREG